jgi:predicted DNA-binding transcriptional regulator YafY
MIIATVQETEQLFWWLQSFGSRVEVLEPKALRKKMIDSVKALAKRYAIDQSND